MFRRIELRSTRAVVGVLERGVTGAHWRLLYPTGGCLHASVARLRHHPLRPPTTACMQIIRFDLPKYYCVVIIIL